MAADVETGGAELPMRAALLAARAGVPTLGYRHPLFPPPRTAGPRAGLAMSSGGASTGSVVEIGAAAGAQPPAILPAVGRDGQLQQQRLARLVAQVELPPIVEQHVIVGLELLFEPDATTRTIRDHDQVRRERQLECVETSHALEPGGRPDPTPHRDEVTRAVEPEGSPHPPEP